MEFQNNQIIDLKTKSMEYNAIITGLNENQNENLPLLVQNLFYARSRIECKNRKSTMLESSNFTNKEIQRQIERFQDQYLFNLQIYTKKKKSWQEFRSEKKKNRQWEFPITFQKKWENAESACTISNTAITRDKSQRWSKVTNLCSRVTDPYTVKRSTDRKPMNYSMPRATTSKRKYSKENIQRITETGSHYMQLKLAW